VLVSVQDRWTVCAEQQTTGLQIVFETHDGTAGDVGHVEAQFRPNGDSTNLDARYALSLRRMY
jgi:hypothetical protein